MLARNEESQVAKWIAKFSHSLTFLEDFEWGTQLSRKKKKQHISDINFIYVIKW